MPALFTIVSANYIALAATLMQSVRRFHPEMARFIVLADAPRDFPGLDLAAEVIACDALGVALLDNMKLWYSVIEFNTAIKPFSFRHLFSAGGFDAAIYLDPDIQLYAPLAHVLEGLDGHSLVLTPHLTEPLQDGRHPSDLAIMMSGVYNLGFAALRNDADGRKLVAWWCDRLFAHCRVDIPGNMFTDQRWMDLAPAFVERTRLLRHPGYNVAYWNLPHRAVTQGRDGGWRVNGETLAFFHFSGIDPADARSFSKHQDRFTVQILGPVAALCDDYRARVLANGWLAWNELPYAYARFGDGRPIEPAMRRWVLAAIDDNRLDPHRPLRLGAAFFDAADERRFAGSNRLTRFVHQLWRDRQDLRTAFNIGRQDGIDGLNAWLCDGAAESEGIDPVLIEAARTLRTRAGAPDLGPFPTRVAPPWPAMATDCWDGPAADVAQWLTGELAFELDGRPHTIERQAALLWERRLDLQHFFPVRTAAQLEDYQLWCLTDGMREGAVDAALFSPGFRSWLTAPWSTSPLTGDAPPGDVPITQAMALTRRSEHGRDALPHWQLFPQIRQARFEQAFWFAFIAPRVFGWPDFLAAPVRAFLQQPVGPDADGFPLTRAMLVCHAMRQDILDGFPLDDEDGRWRFGQWLLLEGTRAFGVTVAELCPGIAQWLARPSPEVPRLTRLALFAHAQRQDLQAAFNLRSRAGLGGMAEWSKGELAPWLDSIGLAVLLPRSPAAPALPPAPCRSLVALSGDWTATSGVGEDLRSTEAALRAVGFADYLVVDLPSGRVHAAGDGGRLAPLPTGTPVQVALNIVHHNADTAAADWARLRALGVAATRMVGHWHWELERLPSRWTYAFSFYDEVWASSRFAAAAFSAGGRRPVRTVNGAVTVPPVEPPSRRRLGLRDDATLFLFMFDWASYATRKNPGAVVRAFQLAFPAGDEPVQLVIKTQNGALWAPPGDALDAATEDARIVLIDEQMTRPELVGLVAAADAFVSLHRSEGYGRAPAEAMLLGKPTVLTGYSGTSDYADDGCACLVGYTLVPVGPGEYPGVEDQRWAEADVAAAARFMRWIHERPDEARRLGERGRDRVATLLDPATVGAATVALIRAAVADRSRRPEAVVPTG